MKKTSLRQANYRQRKALIKTLGALSIIHKIHGDISVKEAYSRLYSELLLLEQNKGEKNVRTKKRSTKA